MTLALALALTLTLTLTLSPTQPTNLENRVKNIFQ